MTPELVFMMGKFEARFPTDRSYAKNHMWAQRQPAGQGPSQPPVRFGFSAYAVRLLQDVYFLDWSVDADVDLREKVEIGSIESSKAESALYAPMAGRLIEFNQTLLADPSMINVEPYGRGWLFEMTGPGDKLLSADEYLIHLEAAWKVAERTIKGQLNE